MKSKQHKGVDIPARQSVSAFRAETREELVDSEDVEDLLVALGIGHFDRSGQYHDQDTYDPDLRDENDEFARRFWEQATQDFSN